MSNEPTQIEQHPVQTRLASARVQAKVPAVVSNRAYEAYCKIWSPQDALVTGNCRGGFGVGELVALLYARSFPKEEWRQRFDEAVNGMQGLD